MPIPKPKSGEDQNDFISRCASMMADEDPEMPNKQRIAICHDTWRKSKTHTSKDWHKLNFVVPINF